MCLGKDWTEKQLNLHRDGPPTYVASRTWLLLLILLDLLSSLSWASRCTAPLPAKWFQEDELMADQMCWYVQDWAIPDDFDWRHLKRGRLHSYMDSYSPWLQSALLASLDFRSDSLQWTDVVWDCCNGHLRSKFWNRKARDVHSHFCLFSFSQSGKDW